MLRHYLLVALRISSRQPFMAATNVLTLSLGLVCFITAYGVVSFWDRAERHFHNSDRTFVVSTGVTPSAENAKRGQAAETNPYVAQYLRVDFPEIEAVARARIAAAAEVVRLKDRATSLFDVSVDREFLKIFDLPFISGNSRTALDEPRSAVLTSDAVTRLFGSEDPIGQSILVRNSVEVTVTGVIDAIPEPSHMGRSATATLRFDMLTSMDVYDYLEDIKRNPRAPIPPENWLAAGVTTYVMLSGDASATAQRIERLLPDFVARHAPAEQLVFAKVDLRLLPVTRLLSASNAGAFFVSGTGMSTSAVILLLGTLVLAVACVNYASLATARATARAKDVGLRKAYGAQATQVSVQYLTEAAVLTAIALIAALLIVAVGAPALRAQMGIDIALAIFRSPWTWIKLAGVVLFVAIAAAAYPAFVLSRVRPAATLRSAKSKVTNGSLVAVLVAVQFSVASFLLIVASFAYLQNENLRRTGLGAAVDPVVVIENDASITKVSANLIRSELRNSRDVIEVGYAAWAPWTRYHIWALSTSPEESAVDHTIFRYDVGDDFFSALQIPILAGRVLNSRFRDVPTMDDPWPIVVDRALVEEFELGSPEDAVGKLVYVPKRFTAGFGRSSPQPMRIVGVVETQPLAILGTGARSTIYTFNIRLPVLIARISKQNVGSALESIDRTWARLVPGVPVKRRFANEFFDEQYKSFARTSQAFAVLTLLAISISSSGLFSMAMLVSSARMREIGVRKTLGASTSRIIALLLNSFSKPVVAANLVAWPIAFVTARAYLAPFIYPIQITPFPFVACLVTTIVVSWVVVAGQTWRAASQKPADILRAE